MPCFYYSPSIKVNTKPKNVPFTEAELGRYVLRMCLSSGRTSTISTRGVWCRWTCVHFSCCLKQLKVSVPMRRPSRKLRRKLLTRARNGRSVLVLSLRPVFPRKSVLRSIATCARSMGARTPGTIPGIVVGMRKTERRNPISMQLRKAVKKQIQ